MKTGLLKLCVVTGSRAEYGLLLPLLKLIKNDFSLQLQLVITGMHLSPEFGSTYQEIEKGGFLIDEKVEMLLSGDSDSSVIKSTGIGLIGFADSLKRLNPDWVIVLGDRFEIFAAATAAHLLKIPIAHLHGGEITEGATDDAMRHAITKMSFLHFTSTEEYRKRVIQLGENPERVFNTGAIGLDNIRHLKLLSKKALEKQLDISITQNTMLVTFHPVTLENTTALLQMKQLLKALDHYTEYQIIFTYPNADAGGRIIIQLIDEWVNKNSKRAKAVASLGQLKYLSVLQYVKIVVGNSSSGIIEVPQFKIPTVNIGERQKGRIKAASVIDCTSEVKNIIAAIKTAISPSFKSVIEKNINPYGRGNAAHKIILEIKKAGKLSSIKKSFYNIVS